MADALYSKKEFAQWRGPTTSDNYNERVENNYKDFVNLTNRIGLTEEAYRSALQRVLKEQFALAKAVEDANARLDVLEAAQKKIVFRTDTQIDDDRFNSTVYAVNDVDALFRDSDHGLLTLPQIVTGTSSKIYFTSTNGECILPPSFESIVVGRQGSLDTQGALIATTDQYGAFLPHSELIWERNVIVDTPNAGGAIIELYAKLPVDLLINENSNTIIVHPFPIMGCELLEVSYSTSQNVTLSVTDNYTPVNVRSLYIGNNHSVGWSAPGSWNGDSITNCGPKAFYFDPQAITAIKIVLRQKNYLAESAKYIYSYGLSQIDVRFTKFLDTGRTIVRFDAPGTDTISSVDDVMPEIWNVAESELPYIFDYRVLWETSYNSGVYTTNPVAFSKRVWIDVTLNKTLGQGSPAISGLVVSYS